MKGDIAQSCDERGEAQPGRTRPRKQGHQPLSFFLQWPVLTEQPACLVTHVMGRHAAFCLVLHFIPPFNLDILQFFQSVQQEVFTHLRCSGVSHSSRFVQLRFLIQALSLYPALHSLKWDGRTFREIAVFQHRIKQEHFS